MELSGGVKQRRNQIEPWSTLFMSASAAIVDVHVRGTGLEGEDFRSSARLFPLAPNLAPPSLTLPHIMGEGWVGDNELS